MCIEQLARVEVEREQFESTKAQLIALTNDNGRLRQHISMLVIISESAQPAASLPR